MATIGCRYISTSVSRMTKRKLPTAPQSIPPKYMANPAANLHFINQLRHKELGPIYRETLGPDVEVVYISDPDMCMKVLQEDGQYPQHLIPKPWLVFNQTAKVKRGLFFLDGPEWQEVRSKWNKILLGKDIEINARAPPQNRVKATQELVSSLMEKSLSGQQHWTTIEMDLSYWSICSLLYSLFGPQLTTDKNTLLHLVESVKGFFALSAQLQYKSSEEEHRVQSKLWLDFSQHIQTAIDISKHIVQCALADNSKDSLIGRHEAKFTPDELAATVMDLIIAAADTTATTALWTLYELSLEENWQYQSAILSQPGLIQNCVAEAMRLYPVAPFITRILRNDIEIDEFVLKKGNLALLSIFSMGRDSRYYPNPDTFWPERHSRHKGCKIGALHPYASIPFGHGPRSCIGRRLANEQLNYLLIALVKKFKIWNQNQSRVNLSMSFSGVPDQKIKICFCERA